MSYYKIKFLKPTASLVEKQNFGQPLWNLLHVQISVSRPAANCVV